MKLSFLFFGNKPDEKWALAKQMGIRYAIVKLAPELTGDEPPYDLDSLIRSESIYREHGFKIIGFEGDQFDMTRIKLGLPGRDEDITKYIRMLNNMGKLGIELLCYNFMQTGWFRTSKDLKARGDALVTGFNLHDSLKLANDQHSPVSSAQIWENYRYFISKVLPAAERAGVKMALHPDDPPVRELMGIGRIFISAEDIRKALSLSDSPSHGLTFCQGTFVTMGEDVKSIAREFATEKRIFFIHIRDVEGSPENFRETFHDDGPTDMPEMFRTYHDAGFDGPLRSDHVPTMYGEENDHAGYAVKGNLFGIGYMKGIMDTLKITQE